MPDYVNPQKRSLDLLGPDGKKITIRPGGRMTLPKFFDRYLSPGLLRRAPVPVQAHAKTQQLKTPDLSTIKAIRRQLPTARVAGRPPKKVVGRHGGVSVTTNVDPKDYPISNNIGVAILSYNRSQSLSRLLNSITAYTDLNRTTVFVCDDASDEPGTVELLNRLEQQAGIVIVRGQSHAGVAVNMNRAFKCLERFKYKLILNDDVEILRSGWDHFYVDAMESTGFHHFCHRQPGIYGAKTGELVAVRDVKLCVVYDKPQGAIFAFDDIAFSAVGYCDENLGMYGMEHVDWSTRVFDVGLQSNGFYDVFGSDSYFRLHNEPSALVDRIEHFNEAKRRLAARKTTGYIAPTNLSAVQTITCVIPMRDTGRHDTIKLVVNNIRAQRVPAIDIIVVEHDVSQHFTAAELRPARLLFVAAKKPAFNKSVAFNTGVAEAASGMLVLHDADTIVPGQYFAAVVNKLRQHESCHFGQRILYTSHTATLDIVATQRVPKELTCDVVVTYFEGGSLGCWSDVYWRVGGFVEEYCGYGCFAGDAPVLMADGTTKPIREIKAGEYVISHLGKVRRVAKTFCRDYDGPARKIRIKRQGVEFTVTDKHAGYVLRDNSIDHVDAEQLTTSDWILTRHSHTAVEPIQSVDLMAELAGTGTYKIRGDLIFPTRTALGNIDIIDGSAIGCPAVLQVDDDLLDLIGYYAAEGCASAKNGIRFSVCCDEFQPGDIGAEILRILKRYGFAPRIQPRGDGKGRDVQVFSLPLVRLLRKWFPGTKNNKKFPDWVMRLPVSQQSRVFAALVRGDGYLEPGRERLRLRMGNKNLVQQAMFLAERCGCSASYSSDSLKSKRTGKRYITHELQAPFSFLSEQVLSCLGLSKKIGHPDEITVAGAKFNRIRTSKSIHYTGLVYNIKVEEEHSYFVGYGAWENCEDCDFYARLSQNSRWCECRDTTFVHLWHDRVDTWRKDHEANKALEQRLQALGKLERVAAARNALRRGPYNRFLTEV